MILTVLIIGALALAACGGDNDADNGEESDFAAEADAICRALAVEEAEISADIGARFGATRPRSSGSSGSSRPSAASSASCAHSTRR